MPASDSEGRLGLAASPILLVSRRALPLAIMVSVYIFRVVTTYGWWLHRRLSRFYRLYLALHGNGSNWIRAHDINYRKMIASGLAIATLTGMGNWLFGRF